MGQRYKTDIVIVGAGPTGLFAIFQCGMLGLRAHVIDALDMPGGQCAALYPEKPIYDIPGHPAILAGDLVDRLEVQAAPFGPVYHWQQQAQSARRVEDGWVVSTSKGTEIHTKGVILAAGGGAFGPNRPPLEGIEAYENKDVFYSVRRKADFSGKKIVIAGGGDSAIDWALALSDTAERLYLVHRRATFRAAPETVAKMHEYSSKGKIALIVPYQLHELIGVAGRLTTVHVASLEGHVKALEADKLLCFFGLSASLGPLSGWGMETQQGHIVVNPQTCETTLPGIFAIGDCVTAPGKLKLIVTGFAEAALAAHALWRFVHPSKELHMEYSTGKGIPVVPGAHCKVQ